MAREFEKILGTQKHDKLKGNSKPAEIWAKKGNDIVDGTDQGDLLYGEEGNDTLMAGKADSYGDRYDGGLDNDTFKIADSVRQNDAFSINLGTGRDSQGNRYFSIENIVGGAGADSFTGNADANTLEGGEGNDALRGGEGNDVLLGQEGDDVLDGGAGADELNGGAGKSDQAIYWNSAAGVDVSLATGAGLGGDAEGDALSGVEHVDGSSSGDILTGDGGNNRLSGRGGNDVLDGGDGDDTLNGGAGADQINGGDGNDTASFDDAGSGVRLSLAAGGSGGRAGGDTYVSVENVLGSDYDDIITGGEGANRLTGAGGNDALNGAGGNDQLVGGSGSDSLNGGAGVDTASYASAGAGVIADLALGGSGGDAAGDTYSSIEFVLGSGFGDVISGDALNNRLYGGAGDDALNGGNGNDTLIGDAGNDTLNGGAGYDVFWFRDLDQGSDAITGFAAGVGMTDRIWLGGASGAVDFAGVLGAAQDTAEGVMLNLANGNLLIAGLTIAALAADDFLF